MDISNTLYKLQQDVFNFSDVVFQTENPADKDFRNACSLFSRHIKYQLDKIDYDTHLKSESPATLQVMAQLCELTELITPDNTNVSDIVDSIGHYQWPGKLLNFCSQIQTLKSKAA